MRRVRFLTLTLKKDKGAFRIFKNPKRIFGGKARGLFNRKCWKDKGRVGKDSIGKVRMVTVREYIDGFLTLRVRNPPIRRPRKPGILKENPRLNRLNFFSMIKTLQVVHLAYHLVRALLF